MEIPRRLTCRTAVKFSRGDVNLKGSECLDSRLLVDKPIFAIPVVIPSSCHFVFGGEL